MTMRPIDLQVVLKQSVNVAKAEKKRINKKQEDKEKAKRNTIIKSTQQHEGVSDVDKTEVDSNVIHEQPRREKPEVNQNKRKKDNENDNKKSPLDDKYKGNFLDITE
ncbi:MAG TPA: hypothetical protein VKS21_00335 [Spirochaetota bacterium]|nr:hypothetical protein [Spirochaetota bacterium]